MAGLSFFAGDAVLSSLYLVGLTLAIIVGYSFLKSVDSSGGGLQSLMLALSAGALVSAAIGWAQWLSLESVFGALIVPSETGRAVGNLAQPNQLATLLLTGLVAYAYLYKQRILGTFTFALAVGFMSTALVMTQSRTGLLGAVVIAGFWGLKGRNIAPRISVFVATAWLAMILVGSRMLPACSDALLITNSAVPRSITNGESRWEIWHQMVQAIGQSPWWGYGWNQTFTAQTVGVSAYPSDQKYIYAHNVVLDLLAWNGIPFGSLIALCVAYWFVSRMLMVKNIAGVFGMITLVPLAVHSLLEFPFAYSYFLFPAGLVMGVVEASLAIEKKYSLAKSWISAAFSVWIFAGLWVAYEYIQIEEDYRVVRFEYLHIGTTPAAYSPPVIYLLSHMGAMLEGARVVVEPGMNADQVEQLRKAAWRFPNGVLAYKYAVALALTGNAAGASKQMVLLRNIFGAQYYKDRKAAFRKLAREKYLQLELVVMP